MTRYVLEPACRVRGERFGLLFYDLRGPRLLFAETGGLLAPEDLREGGDPFRGRSPGEQLRIGRFLQHLAAKGFLREQPLR